MRSSEIVYELRLQIKTGHLRPGDKLPTQRDMAWEFKCSLGTVTRAYAELERLGLTYGEVGRGTFVAEQSDLEQRLSPLSSFATDFGHGGVGVDLSLNQFYHAETDQAMSFAMRRIAKREPYADYSNYNDTRGRYQDLEVAQSWLEEILGGYWSLDKLMITQGGQGGLFLAMKALTSPGDTIATEAFGYPGIKAAALEANLKIQAVEMDDYGMRPESFAALCERHDIKLLVTNPTDHNPTGTTLPLERREEITVIARKHNVIIVEDAVYAPFQVEPSKSFVELAGDVSIYITSFSKVFSPALRVGYMIAPEDLIPKLISVSRAISWTSSTIPLDLVADLVTQGVISRHKRYLIQEGNRRFTMALDILGSWINPVHHQIPGFLPHVWIRMPGTTTPSEFISLARDKKVNVMGGDRFAMSKSLDDHYVRVCLMAVPNSDRLEACLMILAEILRSLETPTVIS